MRVRDKYNSSGCLDMTAYLALRNIERKEKLERQARQDKLNNITKQGKNNNTAVAGKDEVMVVHELKNDVSTVRIHDECYEADSKRLMNSVSRVVSESYKRRYLSEPKAQSAVVVLSDPQPIIATLQA